MAGQSAERAGRSQSAGLHALDCGRLAVAVCVRTDHFAGRAEITPANHHCGPHHRSWSLRVLPCAHALRFLQLTNASEHPKPFPEDNHGLGSYYLAS